MGRPPRRHAVSAAEILVIAVVLVLLAALVVPAFLTG